MQFELFIPHMNYARCIPVLSKCKQCRCLLEKRAYFKSAQGLLAFACELLTYISVLGTLGSFSTVAAALCTPSTHLMSAEK